MEIRPTTWTHHHTHRLFHISQLAAFAFIIASLISGAAMVAEQARTQEVSQTEYVRITATVPEIVPGPAACCGEGILPPLSSQAWVTIAPRSGIPVIKRGSIFEFPNSYPAFEGSSNIANALVFLQINGPNNLTSTVALDKDDKWWWQSPVALTPGSYHITATAQSQAEPSIQATADLYFIIPPPLSQQPTQSGQPAPTLGKPPGQKAGAPNATPVPAGQGGLSVRVEIPEHFKTIAPGDELVIFTTVYRFGVKPKNNMVEIRYRIEDSQHKLIVGATERMPVADKSSIVKSFLTSPLLAQKTYTVIAQINYDNGLAVSSDSFVVQGKPTVGFIANTKIDLTALIWAFFALILLFCIIAFFEYQKVKLVSMRIRQENEARLAKPVVG